MLINRAYRYELDPNGKQLTQLLKSAGIARFAWNWGLEHRIRKYRANEGNARFTNFVWQNRDLNKLKEKNFPWMCEVSKCVPQEALRNLSGAFDHFYAELRRAKEEGRKPKVGLPRFKKKGRNDSFRLTGSIRISGTIVQLPRLGKIKTKEETGVKGRILSATVRRSADRWFVSLSVEEEIPNPNLPEGPFIGVDFGISHLATLSDGRTFENPRPLKRYERKLNKLNRSHAHKRSESKNQLKSAIAVARLHRRITNIRRDAQHKLTTMLAKNHSLIAVESLGIRGMMQNHSLAGAIGDCGWGGMGRMLLYKTAWYGSKLATASRMYPSSRRCSQCGFVLDRMPLSDRIFRCPSCGLVLDRDVNAARNLLVAASSAETVIACLRGEVHASMQVPPNDAGTEHRRIRFRPDRSRRTGKIRNMQTVPLGSGRSSGTEQNRLA